MIVNSRVVRESLIIVYWTQEASLGFIFVVVLSLKLVFFVGSEILKLSEIY